MNDSFLQRLDHQLVVSCQALPGSAMDRTDIVLAMARAAVDGGAAAVRIEGVDNVRAVASHFAGALPIIGIVKRDLPDSPVRITPFAADAAALASAGASIIAFDATLRPRPEPMENILQAVRAAGRMAMADCSSEQDALAAWRAGCDLVGTTLSGYTAETETTSQEPERPDMELIARLAKAGCRVVAEGRFRTPEQAAEALRRGAFCVTVGSAITRIEHITGWFTHAMRAA